MYALYTINPCARHYTYIILYLSISASKTYNDGDLFSVPVTRTLVQTTVYFPPIKVHFDTINYILGINIYQKLSLPNNHNNNNNI